MAGAPRGTSQNLNRISAEAPLPGGFMATIPGGPNAVGFCREVSRETAVLSKCDLPKGGNLAPSVTWRVSVGVPGMPFRAHDPRLGERLGAQVGLGPPGFARRFGVEGGVAAGAAGAAGRAIVEEERGPGEGRGAGASSVASAAPTAACGLRPRVRAYGPGEAPWEKLGFNRRTYFRWKKAGKLGLTASAEEERR